jgi:hypothetical protein
MNKEVIDRSGINSLRLSLIVAFFSIPGIIKSLQETKDIIIGNFVISANVVVVTTFLLSFFALGLWVFGRLKIKKEGAKIIAQAASNTIALSGILIEDCQKIIRTGEIDRIINYHNNNIIKYTDNIQINIRDNIYDVINEDFFEGALQALRNNTNKKRFEPVIAQAYNNLAGLNTLENYIKGEFNDTLKEIKDFILKWLKDEDISKYLEVNKDLQEQILELKNRTGSKFFFFFNPQLKDIISLDYEKEVLIAAALIPAFNILSAKVAAGFSTATVASVGLALANFGVHNLDFTDSLTSNIHDEIGNNVASELFEYVGAAIPYIGFAFLALKVIRYFGIFINFINKPEKLREMREKIAFQLSQFINSVCTKSTYEMEQSSFQLVSILKERFIETQNKASMQLNQARKFI